MNKVKLIFFTLIITLIFVFVWILTYNIIEPKAYDFMTRHFMCEKFSFDKYKKVYGSDDILLIVIDAKSTERYRWPWKRELYCKIFEYLKIANPKAIIYDSIIITLDKDNPESDKKFFKTVSKLKNMIVGFSLAYNDWEDKTVGEKNDKIFAEKFALNVNDLTGRKPQFYKSMLPMPNPYFDAVSNVGSVNIISGFINGNIARWAVDEVFRCYEYVISYKNYYLPSFALKAFTLVNNVKEIELTDGSLKFPELRKEVKHKLTKYQMVVPIKFYKLYPTGYSHLYCPAVDIMDSYDAIMNGRKPKIDPENFKDKIVLVGANVPAGAGLYDYKNTPVSINHPGVDIQASAIENIIKNDFLKIVPQYLNIFITLLGMVLVYSFIRFSSLSKSISSVILIIFGYLILSALSFYFGFVINVITPIVLFILTTILAYTHKFVLENRSKEKVKTAMGKYMSEDVMKRVIQNIDNLGLGGKKSTVTVLFADIRGFTSMSEQMSAQEVSEILNEYFTEIEPIITNYNGVINKFIGDAVMAIFGEPIQDKNHAQNAVKCAYAMLKKVKELQKKWVKEGKPKIDIGVGINTGEVFVGNIGSVNRMEYTVIGDTVNLASRLESYNKIYKTQLLISTSTYEEVKGIADVIKISDVQIRGKANKMDIYEVLKVEI